MTLGILFSRAVRVVIVAKLVILDILTLTSFIVVLAVAVVDKIEILGVFPLTSFILALRAVLAPALVKSYILS